LQSWFHIFPKNTVLNIFVWIAFCILPFYFIFRSSSFVEITIGIILTIVFFTAYRLSFIKKGWTVYVSVAIKMIVNVAMTLYFGYVYFALFLAFFIGNIQNKAGFITLYVVHLVTTIAAVVAGFFVQSDVLLSQLPFIILSVLGVIILPFGMYNRRKRENLENELENANERISELMVTEERHRIARDLHDTLGQKLSLIGMKSDLAGKLIQRKPEQAKKEIDDIHRTARTALKEVREMVSHMRYIKLKDELTRIQEMMKAAHVQMEMKGNTDFKNTPLLIENIASMCLKEAATNIVKHSKATSCKISIQETEDEIQIEVHDNGVGGFKEGLLWKGNGLRGMKERLEFVNGKLEIDSSNGTMIRIKIPMNEHKQMEMGGFN
jgi:two-component system sensor histidine kinase DesK